MMKGVAAPMKPSAIRIERMLEKLEARRSPPQRRVLHTIIHEGEDDEAAAMEKALAEHVACHPEAAGRTVKDFRWIMHVIVRGPQSDGLPAAEISEAEISATEARNEITKGEIEDALNGCKGTDGPSETPLIDLPPPDPGFLARSKLGAPCINVLFGRTGKGTGAGMGEWQYRRGNRNGGLFRATALKLLGKHGHLLLTHVPAMVERC
jgi:hypothetical protein